MEIRKSLSVKVIGKVLVVISILFPAISHAQKTGQARIDSMVSQLPKLRDDSNKVKLLFRVSYAYYTLNPDEGLKFAWQQLEISSKINWPTGIVRAYSSAAVNYMGKGDYPKALENEFIALRKSEELNDKDDMEVALENIGIIYRMQRNLDKALEYELKSLKLSEELGDKKKLANNIGNVGDAYWAMGKYDKALEYELRALKMSEELGDKSNIAKNLGNIGNVYQDQGKYAEALPYDLKALAIYQERNDKYGMARNLGNVGALYIDMELPTAKFITKPDSLIPAGKHERVKKGIAYLEKAISLSREIQYMDALVSFTLSLSQGYELDGDYKNALKYRVHYYQIQDSVFSNANKQKIKEIENKQALEIKEKDIELAQLAVAKKRNERGFYLGGIALLLVVTGVVLKNYRKQKYANALLNEEKIKSDGLMLNLQASLKQKEVLMKEIHHRVKNNLQVISHLLELQGQGTDNKVARDAIAEGQSRVRSIALIHHKLYQDEDISTIEFNAFVKELYAQVTSVFSSPDQRLDVKFEVPETFLDIDTAVPLGLIINELLTNAFKYAFKPDVYGTLTIGLKKVEDHYMLEFKDNGPGLPKGQDIRSFESLGMKLVNLLSKQLGGYTEYRYDGGSVFLIYFKDINARKQVM